MDCLTTDVMFHSSFSPLPETMTLLLASIVSHWPGLIVWGLGGVWLVSLLAAMAACLCSLSCSFFSSGTSGSRKTYLQLQPPVRDSFTFTSQQRMLTPSLCLR